MYLVPAEKGDRSTNAVNSRVIAKMLLEVQSQPLLCAPADAKHYVPGTPLLDAVQQFFVGDRLPVKRRQIDIFIGHADAILTQPAQIALRGASRRHDPEGVSHVPKIRLFDQRSQIFQSR